MDTPHPTPVSALRSTAFAAAVLFTTLGLSLSTRAQWMPTSGPQGADLRSLSVQGSRLYAGTSAGIYSSSNNGATWALVNTGLQANTTAYAFAIAGSTLYAGTTSGLYASINNGGNWTRITSGMTAGTVFCFLRKGTRLFAGTNAGVFATSDDGATWTSLRTGLTTPTVRSMALDGDTLVAGTAGGGVFLSTNDGTTWTSANTGLTNLIVRSLAVGEGVLVAGTNGGGAFVSANHGATWTQSNTGLTSSEIVALAFSGSTLYAGSNGAGVSRSSDKGATWTSANTGLTLSTVFTLEVSGSNLYAGTSGGGVFFSNNQASTWTDLGSTLSGNAVVLSLTSSGSRLLAGTGGRGIALSTNNGSNWSGVLPNANIRAFLTKGTLLYSATNDGVYRSADQGASWSPTGPGLTNKVVTSLTLVGEDLVCGTQGAGVFLSSNLGTSWSPINSPQTATAVVTALAVSGQNLLAGTNATGLFLSNNKGASWTLAGGIPVTNATNAFAAIEPYLFAGHGTAGVFRSSDHGATWTAVNGGLTNTAVLSLEAVGNRLFAGTSAGVFVSANQGASWSSANTSLTTTLPIRGFAVVGDTLFTGTESGVWRRPLAELATPAASLGRLINVSVRGSTGPGAQALNVGMVVAGGSPTGGTLPVLLRAVGPSLAGFGVPNVLADPRLELYSGSVRRGENDDWGGDPQIAQLAGQVGAFPLSGATSKDAALSRFSLGVGSHSAVVTGTGDNSAVVLAELYDSSPTDATGPGSPRLVNASARIQVNAASGVAILGFVVGGETSRTLVLRAIGPSLAAFGITGALADPVLELYSRSTRLRENDNWSSEAAANAAAFSQVGAFGLNSASKDAAMVVTLPPGAYTAMVKGVNAATGVALIELYEVP